jgi:hypothetical protein
MSPQRTTSSRQIVLTGMVARAPGSKVAISLVDEAGELLDSAFIDDDGRCELSEEALVSARSVLVEHVNVLVEADRFRQLIGSEKCVDVTELLAATGHPATSSCPGQDHDDDKFHPPGHFPAHADPSRW